MTHAITRRSLTGLAAAALATPALGQGRFPQRDLTWIVYQSPGGSIDVTTRTIQPFLEARGFKSQLEYATGAGGRVARAKLASNRADGHTIMTEVAPAVSVDTALFEVPYTSETFAPIYGWQSSGGQLNVKKDSPIRNMADFVAECRKRRVVVASIGRGGAHHLQLLAMRRDLGVPFDIAHFNGSSAAYAQVIGGHVDASIGGPASGSRALDNLHIIGVFEPERARALPDHPTVAEQNLKVQLVAQLFFCSARAAVPADRRAALTTAFREAFSDPQLVERMNRQGEFPVLLEPGRITEILAAESALVQAFKDELRV
ncbi:tripartite tricarboxylate transporter substrate-binding protein [Falsiroseomonas sp. E2-1-a20]|uniref:tripartite tricarboxylate transporter substrate-binding protein n=1 Tax=Falsiroseomonas sp. E2-1-a20 TaxID=3239300 RepID=UPI003F3C4EB2